MFARSGTVTVRICVVWTLLDLLVGMVAHPRFRVFHRQSANPYAAVGFPSPPTLAKDAGGLGKISCGRAFYQCLRQSASLSAICCI